MRHTSDGITINHGVVAILRHADRVVLVQQQGDDNKPFWVLPGGLVEAGELIPDALIREVLEEAGVQVTAITQLACLSQMNRPDQYRKVRKNIARVKTVLRAQEIGAAGKLGAAS